MEYVDPSSVEYDFDDKDVLEFGAVPPGTYLCRIDEARPGVTRAGHPRWGLKFVVHEGQEVGRIAAWDGLTFSPMAAARTKQILGALGLPHEGKVRLKAEDLLGRLAFVTVELGEYRHPTTGVVMRRNQVPYGGVTPARGDESPGNGSGESDPGDGRESEAAGDIPF